MVLPWCATVGDIVGHKHCPEFGAGMVTESYGDYAKVHWHDGQLRSNRLDELHEANDLQRSAYQLKHLDVKPLYAAKPDVTAMMEWHAQPVVPALTGGSSDYYKVYITGADTTSGGNGYMAECNDIIEALNMNYAEGNAFKAIWRIAAARKGNGKPGTTALYDSEKVEFFGHRLTIQNSREK
jgi:hypothetical protein